ncbi:MAG: hypothetical protein ACXVZW_09120 [Gaiellaceae bacterium]
MAAPYRHLRGLKDLLGADQPATEPEHVAAEEPFESANVLTPYGFLGEPPDAMGRVSPLAAPGLVGLPRPHGDWDAMVSVRATGLDASEIDFVTLEDGDIVIESDLPSGDLAPLAEAVEGELAPPYHAYAYRHEQDVWAVAARKIRIARFEDAAEEIELSVNGDERVLVADGREQTRAIPELEQLGAGMREGFVARAVKIDEDLWEVEVMPL